MSKNNGITFTDTPDWVKAAIKRHVADFGLAPWNITVRCDDKLLYSEDSAGEVAYKRNYLEAVITFKADLEADLAGQEVVLHEVLHIVLSEMRQIVESIIKLVPLKRVRKELERQYDSAEERLITLLCRAITRRYMPDTLALTDFERKTIDRIFGGNGIEH